MQYAISIKEGTLGTNGKEITDLRAGYVISRGGKCGAAPKSDELNIGQRRRQCLLELP